MEILDRVVTNSNICKVQLAFNGVSKASIITGWQPFYNSTFQDADFKKAYASLSSIDFEEESIQSSAGTSYAQKVVFRFPMNDKKRAERIALMQKIKFVKLTHTNGLDLIVGRNDYNQNARPKVKIQTNRKLCEVTVECKSIFPSGFSPSLIYGLPTYIPLQV
jgi:hypothetical protein